MLSVSLVEHTLAAVQYGVLLFLLSSGLTLTFGVMGLINLSHGSVYVLGAYVAAATIVAVGSFILGMIAGVVAAGVVGIAIEFLVIRKLYARDHLYQVLATFGLILIINESISIVFGRQPLRFDLPALLSGSVQVVPGLQYPIYRLMIIGAGATVGGLLYILITRSRVGMLIRAGSTHRPVVAALGTNITLLFTLVFAIGSMLAGLAGVLISPITGVDIGMGDTIIIVAFVVIIIGGIGSVHGALAGSALVAVVDTLSRAALPSLLLKAVGPVKASAMSAGLSSMSVYILMAVVLLLRPRGLFAAQ
jgi:branched-chain amino acid transport system permease protein